MPEKLCDDCGLPISVCNAKAMVRIAVERNGLACVGDIMPAPANLPPKVVAFQVHDFLVAKHPTRAFGIGSEPTEYLYPAHREADAKEAANILRGQLTPLYALDWPHGA